MSPALATSLAILATFFTTLGQPVDVSRPAQGYQVGIPEFGYDIIMPISVVQCEGVPIFYNITNTQANTDAVQEGIPDFQTTFLTFSFPNGTGYLTWICNIPANRSFVVTVNGGDEQLYTVQSGSSSACLGNITTSYSYANYNTTIFQSYTQQSYPVLYSTSEQSTVAFPTSSFPTVIVNPITTITPTTSASAILPSTSSSPTASSLEMSIPEVSSPAPTVSSPAVFSRNSNRATIAGAVIGGVALMLVAIVLVFRQKRRKSRRYYGSVVER